ncbi:MAG: hypothetical protein MUF51_08580 [Vicinamibacteria bacterium]|jgi:hypothetical protein|nr:hypothetical protein [Vicinamibacteria bacterium]
MSWLTAQELTALVRSAFPRFEGDRALAILVDVPRDAAHDNPAWAARRRMCAAWHEALCARKDDIPLEDVRLIAYPDVGSNNADLPAEAVSVETTLTETAADLASAGRAVACEDVFRENQILLAPTEYSTTAPLKVAAKRFGFRAATMPGFAPAMIPALRVDYTEVARRVDLLKARLDRAEAAELRLVADGERAFTMHFDLRHRSAHASAGRFPERGTAGNLPSGEAYIVPYEGERGAPSATEGHLPVQIDDEIVVFEVRANRVVNVLGTGPAAETERDHLRREPAYGNMAELGLGVLADFGVTPVGEILLDEKLGLHVAFGRSEHFGGIVGPKDFSSPAAVIHLDRIYIPATQPRITVASLTLLYPGGEREEVLRNGTYRTF